MHCAVGSKCRIGIDFFRMIRGSAQSSGSSISSCMGVEGWSVKCRNEVARRFFFDIPEIEKDDLKK